MILVCPKCATRLQVDEEKSPARPFNVRCPKCNSTVSSGVASPASEHGALAVGGSPSTEHPRFEQNTARAYEPVKANQSAAAATTADDSIRALMELLSKGTTQAPEKPDARPAWDSRKALVCTAENYRDTVAQRMTDSGCQVFVAEDTRQAIETMRSNKMDVVVLESQFDPAEQGLAFVTREINVLRPPQRRRVFFVLLSPSLRTMDAHAAFLNNVNLVVNIADLDELSRIMDVALREYNELYRDFNRAFSLTAL
ncbi:MAG TPA: MJ0042-type zinc finger domain-containing protein [Pyrinomonadaceae bacterium]|nr:MJ0042-type zinc finger domain-containing protein [Pyrinomonadaceae bacterium]